MPFPLPINRSSLMQTFNRPHQFRLRHPAHRHLGLAIHGEEEEGRDRANVKGIRKFGFLVDIHLVNIYATFILLRHLVNNGLEHFAGTAPCGIKVNHSRATAQELPLLQHCFRVGYAALKAF